MQEVQKKSDAENKEKQQISIGVQDEYFDDLLTAAQTEKEKQNKPEKETKPVLDKPIDEKQIKTRNIKIIGGRYAKEIEDDIPPLETMRYVDKYGGFTDKKPKSIEDVAYYWRAKTPTLALILAFCAFGLLLILLAATTKYADMTFELIVFLFDQFFAFFTGLF